MKRNRQTGPGRRDGKGKGLEAGVLEKPGRAGGWTTRKRDGSRDWEGRWAALVREGLWVLSAVPWSPGKVWSKGVSC